MHHKKYLLIFISLILATTLTNSSNAQSWSMTTIINNNDTVADEATVCTFDNAGNTYWASRYYVANTAKTGYWIWKVDKGGGTINAKKLITLSSPAYTIQPIIDMEVISGSLYVLLDIKKASTPFDNDICVQKYDLNLSKKWESIYSVVNVNSSERGGMITDGPSSGILVSLTSGNDARVLNYSKSNGQLLNSLLYNNGNGSTETINKVHYSGGILYIGGKNDVTAGNKIDMFIAKYDSNLTQTWNRVFDASSAILYDEIKDLTIDANNDIIITGDYLTTTGANRVFFAKYNDVNGNRLWIRRINEDFLFSNQVFTGSSLEILSIVSGQPCRYISLNNVTGSINVSKGIFNNPNINFVVKKAVKGITNDIYVIGDYDSTYTSGGITTTEQGVLVSKILSNGSRQWNDKTTTSNLTQSFTSADIAIKSSNRIFYSFNLLNPLTSPKKTYSIYTSVGASNGNRMSDNETAENHLSVYPNPASGNINIKLSTTTDTNGRLKLFTSEGRIISDETIPLKSGEQTLNLNLEHFQPGLYILQIQQDATIWNEKILLQ
ncbi:MAG: T9SS type A sorting domain-containing protein [Bacteroidetes bacterium]|nr:T9SS type A sorting domain-containing protein [Bacteroidota bacterium]